MKKIFAFLIFLLIYACSGVKKSPMDSTHSFSLLYYDVENLYDTINNSGVLDNPFTPDGALSWNTSKYKKKIAGISNVLDSIHKFNPTTNGIVILQEVENIEVARNLQRESIALHANHLQAVYPPAQQNLNCVVFLNNQLFHIKDLNYFTIDKSLESISLFSIKISTPKDSLRLLIVQEERIPGKQTILLEGYPSLHHVLAYIDGNFDRREKILLTGRFNPGHSKEEVISSANQTFQNLLHLAANNGKGTIHKNGQWMLSDQIWANQSLSNAKDGIRLSKKNGDIYSAEFMLKENPKADATIPFPTFGGPNYFGGISNHLPVIIELETSN